MDLDTHQPELPDTGLVLTGDEHLMRLWDERL